MNDLISRQAAIGTAVKAAVDWHKLANPQYSIAYCIGEAMRELPSAQPERTGKWIETIKHYKDDEQEYDYIEVNCSECGVRRKIGWRDANYCPMCGADMKGEEE